MKIKDIFKDVYAGKDIGISNEEDRYAYALKTSNLDECVISVSSKDLYKYDLSDIKDKYILRENDIVIACTKSSSTAHVGFASSLPEYPIIIGKNLVVLRNIYEEYEPLFVAEYLERFGMNKLFATKSESYRLQLVDLYEVNIPDVDIDTQRKLVELFKLINERTKLYKKNIENDSNIIKELISNVIPNEEDK